MATTTYEAQNPLTGAHLDETMAREKDVNASKLGTEFAKQKEAQREAMARAGTGGTGAAQQQQNRLGEAQVMAYGGMVGQLEADFGRQKTGAKQFDATNMLGQQGFQETARSNLAREGLAKNELASGNTRWEAEFKQRQAEALNNQKMMMLDRQARDRNELLTFQRSSPNYGTYQTGGYFGQPKQASGAAASYPTYQAPSQPIQTAPKPTATLGFSRTTTRPTTGLGWG